LAVLLLINVLAVVEQPPIFIVDHLTIVDQALSTRTIRKVAHVNLEPSWVVQLRILSNQESLTVLTQPGEEATSHLRPGFTAPPQKAIDANKVKGALKESSIASDNPHEARFAMFKLGDWSQGHPEIQPLLPKVLVV
jgi:hypothetical protein